MLLEISLKSRCNANLARHLAQHSISGNRPWSGSNEAQLMSPASMQQAKVCSDGPRCSRQPLPWPLASRSSDGCWSLPPAAMTDGLAALATDMQLVATLSNPRLSGSLPLPICTQLHQLRRWSEWLVSPQHRRELCGHCGGCCLFSQRRQCAYHQGAHYEPAPCTAVGVHTHSQPTAPAL